MAEERVTIGDGLEACAGGEVPRRPSCISPARGELLCTGAISGLCKRVPVLKGTPCGERLGLAPMAGWDTNQRLSLKTEAAC